MEAYRFKVKTHPLKKGSRRDRLDFPPYSATIFSIQPKQGE